MAIPRPRPESGEPFSLLHTSQCPGLEGRVVKVESDSGEAGGRGRGHSGILSDWFCGQIFVEESGGGEAWALESESLGQNHICCTC